MKFSKDIDIEFAEISAIPQQPVRPLAVPEQIPIQPVKGNQLRHFKALMRKNMINWKRTWLGSILEIICPMLLMVILVVLRYQITPFVPNMGGTASDIFQLKRPYYPPVILDADSGNWSNSNFNLTSLGVDLIPFMNHTDYISNLKFQSADFYNPLVDPLGPFYFFPPNCFGKFVNYNSPIVGYIAQENQIEKDMVQQLSLFFQKQSDFKTYIYQFIDAIQNPFDHNSIKIFLDLLDGGTTQQKLDLIYKFGLPTQVIGLIELLVVNSQSEYQFFQQFVNTPQNIISSASQIQNTTTLQQLIQLQNNNNLVQTAFKAGLNSSQTDELLQIATSQGNLDETLNNIGLNQTQTQALILQIQSYNYSKAQNDPYFDLIQMEQNLNLTSDQINEVLKITQQYDITQQLNNIGLNQTQIDQLQPQIVNYYNSTLNEGDILNFLSYVVQGNITQYQFQQITGFNVDQAAKQIGLNDQQENQLLSALDQRDTQTLILSIINSNGSQQNLNQIEQIYGVTPDQIQLVQQAITTNQVNPYLFEQILQLQANQSQYLNQILNNTQQLNTSFVQTLIPELQSQFSLNQTQTDQLIQILNQSSQTSQDQLVQTLSTQLNLTQSQEFYLNLTLSNITDQSQLNSTLLFAQLGLNQTQQELFNQTMNEQSNYYQFFQLVNQNSQQPTDQISQLLQNEGMNETQAQLVAQLLTEIGSLNQYQSSTQNQSVYSNQLLQTIQQTLNLNQDQIEQLNDTLNNSTSLQQLNSNEIASELNLTDFQEQQLNQILNYQNNLDSFLSILSENQQFINNDASNSDQLSKILVNQGVELTQAEQISQFIMTIASQNLSNPNFTQVQQQVSQQYSNELLTLIQTNLSLSSDQIQVLNQILSNSSDPSQLNLTQITSQLNLTESQQQILDQYDYNQKSMIYLFYDLVNNSVQDVQNKNISDQNQAQLTEFLQSYGFNQQQIEQINSILEIRSRENLQGNLTNTSSSVFQTVSQRYQIIQSVIQLYNDIQAVTAQNYTEIQAIKESSQKFDKTYLNNLLDNLNFQYFGEFQLKRFENNDEFTNYLQQDGYGQSSDKAAVCFAFEIFENSGNDYELDLKFFDYFPDQFRGIPRQIWPAYDTTARIPDLGSYSNYVDRGYILINNWFANTILKRKTGVPEASIVTMIVPSKVGILEQDLFAFALQTSLTLFLLLSYVPIMYRTVYRIVFEKYSKAKESMRMMGMSDFPYWASWILQYTIINTLIAFFCWAVLSINVIQQRSSFFLFAVIWIYGQSLFGLIIITQSLFSVPRSAATTTTIIYFGLTIAQQIIKEGLTPRDQILSATYLIPQVAMCQTISVFVKLELNGFGVTEHSWTQQHSNFSVKDGIQGMVISGTIMFIIGFYMEAVMPKTYGKQVHPLFFLGFPCKNKKNTAQRLDDNSQTDDEVEFETKYLKKECYEAPPNELLVQELSGNILKISNLRKQYENGFKAVNGINLKMYSDQIFVLLGHNGAGKSTTISMLTGLLSKSEGIAKVFGIDIFNNMNQVRQFMGVCPQYDVLFELLTTEEHLQFFYELKGANPDPKIKQAEIEKLMEDVGVIDKRNALAYQLSGGNKRRLSVAIALCGQSKFVLLDEPTSGMDLTARRQMWNILKEYKKDRIIVLTTHYMDEADILGDRIGIMAKGKMTCLGSSIFLKNKFGEGYNLTLVKKNGNLINTELLQYLKQKLGQKVKLQSEVQQEMTIQIPQEYSYKFKEFFKDFDENLPRLNVLEYGFSLSTLEEVFMKVGHLEDPTKLECVQQVFNRTDLQPGEQSEDADTDGRLSIGSNENLQVNFNMSDNLKELDETFLTSLQSVMIKRINNYKRNKKALFNEVFFPSLLILVGVGLSYTTANPVSPSKLWTPDLLPLPQQLLLNLQTIIPSDTNMDQFANYLPGNNSFEPTYTQNNSFYQFGDDMFNLGEQKAPEPPYLYGSYLFFEANKETQQYKFSSFANLTSQDASALYPQFMYESILKVATGDPDFKFKLRNTPFPPTFAHKEQVAGFNSGQIVFYSAISYSVMMVSIVSQLVVERRAGLKHLQEISGMKLKAYWLGNFIIDFIKMQITILVTIGCYNGINLGLNQAIYTYLLFPFSVLPFTYVTSFIFEADSAAQTFTMFIHFFVIGMISSMIYVMKMTPNQELLGDILNYVLKIIPSYPIASSVYCDTSCKSLWITRIQQGNYGLEIYPDPMYIMNIPLDLIFSIWNMIFWAFILILIEIGYFSKFKRNPDAEIVQADSHLDDDVVIEAERLKQKSEEEQPDAIEVHEFKKVYELESKQLCKTTSLVAVNKLSFSLKNGECFALLGVNGAGKTTTFKSLTCEVKPTSGKIKIAGYDVSTQFEQARKLIGYCPQPNLIFDSMSVEEHLFYYARIKGIPIKKRKQLVDQVITQLNLEDHRNKPAGTLSGGNQRKLCVAQAIVGNPPIILLDEPSAGMDPEARRFMWSVIAKISRNKTSAIVLTTHSMEEAEALSTKMGIMVKGGIFKCFGSSQHIKNKFGTGYVIELKIMDLQVELLNQKIQNYFDENGQLILHQSTPFELSIIREIDSKIKILKVNDQKRQLHQLVCLYMCIHELCKTFHQVELIEQYGNYMRLRVAKLDKSIGFLFGLIETYKINHDVSNYSVSQTSLEQIFQSFADLEFNEKVIKFRNIANEDSESHAQTLTIIKS